MFFDSRRSPVLALNGMVATSQPLAAQAGLQVLINGGNAVDAAVAAAATLNVVEPESTGVGGDMFALVWNHHERKVHALNGSGRAPSAASIDELRNQGHYGMPQDGPYSVSVPGTVHGWETILAEHGTMPLKDALAPAIRYAEQGFPVSDYISYQWSGQGPRLSSRPSGQEMLLNGRPPRQGEVMKLPTLAKTLRAVAEGGSEAFYTGRDSGEDSQLRPGAGRLDHYRRPGIPHLRLGRGHQRRLPRSHLLGVPAQRPGYSRAGGPEHR